MRRRLQSGNDDKILKLLLNRGNIAQVTAGSIGKNRRGLYFFSDKLRQRPQSILPAHVASVRGNQNLNTFFPCSTGNHFERILTFADSGTYLDRGFKLQVLLLRRKRQRQQP